MPNRLSEYRVQRADVKWGSGQGHYILAKSGLEAKKIVAKSMDMKPGDFMSMRWKEYPSMRLTKEARKHLKL
jgi:hypothetical protein